MVEKKDNKKYLISQKGWTAAHRSIALSMRKKETQRRGYQENKKCLTCQKVWTTAASVWDLGTTIARSPTWFLQIQTLLLSQYWYQHHPPPHPHHDIISIIITMLDAHPWLHQYECTTFILVVIDHNSLPFLPPQLSSKAKSFILLIAIIVQSLIS